MSCNNIQKIIAPSLEMNAGSSKLNQPSSQAAFSTHNINSSSQSAQINRTDIRFRIHKQNYIQNTRGITIESILNNISEIKVPTTSLSQDKVSKRDKFECAKKGISSKGDLGNESYIKIKELLNSADVSNGNSQQKEGLNNQLEINNEKIQQLMNQNRSKGYPTFSPTVSNFLSSSNVLLKTKQISSLTRDEANILFLSPQSEHHKNIKKKHQSPNTSSLQLSQQKRRTTPKASPEHQTSSSQTSYPNVQSVNQLSLQRLQQNQPLSSSIISVSGKVVTQSKSQLTSTEGNEELSQRAIISPRPIASSAQSLRKKNNSKSVQASSTHDFLTSRSERRQVAKGDEFYVISSTKGIGSSFSTHQKVASKGITHFQSDLEQNGKLVMSYKLDSMKAKKSYGELQDIVLVDKFKQANTSNSINLFDYQQSQIQSIKEVTKASTPSLSTWADSLKRMQNPFLSSGYEDIEEILKKELPNLSTDVPSNRQEVIILQKWFENNTKNCSQQDENKIFKHLNLCLNELLRQISLDCYERGALLKDAILQFAQLSSQLLGKIRDNFAAEKVNMSKEVEDIKKLYQTQYEQKDVQLETLIKQNEEFNNRFKEESSVMGKFNSREKDMNSQLNHMRSIATFLQTQLKAQSKDNVKLRIKLKKKFEADDKLLQKIQNKLNLENNSSTSLNKSQINTLESKHQEQSQFSSKGKGKKASILKDPITGQKANFFGSIKQQKSIPTFHPANLSDSDANLNNSHDEQELSMMGETNFSLSQPYIRKLTISDQFKLNSLQQFHSTPRISKSEQNSPIISYDRPSKDNMERSMEKKMKSSAQSNTHISELTKKVLEIAIQEQKEESEMSSISSEESKLILDEEQNDMVNIDQLNAIGFLDPETAIRKECQSTQVNDSLLHVAHSDVSIQTQLTTIDSKYDEFIVNNTELDYLIEFRISGFNELQSSLLIDSNIKNPSSRLIPSMQLIPLNTNPKQLKNPISLYKGKFNKFEKMFEESQLKIVELQKSINQSALAFSEREKELLLQITQIKVQLKQEKEEEEKRQKEKEEEERRKKKEEEDAERLRREELKKQQEVPNKWKNYQQNNKKKAPQAEPLKSNAPKLGQRIALDFEQKYQTDAGQQIVEKLQSKKYMKFKNFMPLSTLMKQINLIYQDRVKLIAENPRFREISCANFSYIFLTKLFGLKKIVDQKYIIFILSLKKFAQIFRVNIFSRFIGILEQKGLNYSLDEFNKYIEAIDYIQNQCTIGKDLEVSESETKYYVPYLKVASFVGNFADSRMTQEETIEFKKEIDQLKEIDPKYQNVPIVDIDVFINRMLSKYKMLVNRAKAYVINAFDSSDLDGNGLCNLEEFLILNRNIEHADYNEEILTNIFNDNADHIQDGEQALTFDKFAAVCVDFGLFSEEAQDNFIGIRHKREIDIKFEELKIQWPIKQKEYENKLNSFKYTEDSVKDKWKEIIEVLSSKINNREKQELKPLLIAEKTLAKELELIESYENEGYEDEEALNQYLEQGGKELYFEETQDSQVNSANINSDLKNKISKNLNDNSPQTSMLDINSSKTIIK